MVKGRALRQDWQAGTASFHPTLRVFAEGFAVFINHRMPFLRGVQVDVIQQRHALGTQGAVIAAVLNSRR